MLKGAALTSGLVLGFHVGFRKLPFAEAAATPRFAPNAFVSIDETGLVTVVASRSEMGTGINAVAHWVANACETWSPTQNPTQVRQTVAQVLGINETDVTVNVTLFGGGFGRKSKPDYVAEAALLSRMVGAPVKVTWTREDDI